MTPVEALDLEHLPEPLIVLGGVEVARGIGRYGSKGVSKAMLIGAV